MAKTNRELLNWATQDTRTEQELRDACAGLGINLVEDPRDFLRRKILSYMLSQELEAAAKWDPTQEPTVVEVVEVSPTGEVIRREKGSDSQREVLKSAFGISGTDLTSTGPNTFVYSGKRKWGKKIPTGIEVTIGRETHYPGERVSFSKATFTFIE